MKLLVHECSDEELEDKIKWLTNNVGLPVFKVHKNFNPITFEQYSQIVVIVMDPDTESFLKLKYPAGTFKDFSA